MARLRTNAVHHKCICTGQIFTFEEWCLWCKQHSSSEIVFEHNGFKFNIHDVCLTPNQPVNWKGKDCFFIISTAQSPNGKWEYGLDYNFHFSVGCHACGFVDDMNRGFQNERESIFEALKCLEEKCVMEITNNESRQEYDDWGNVVKMSSAIPNLKTALKQILKLKDVFDPHQLTLFE